MQCCSAKFYCTSIQSIQNVECCLISMSIGPLEINPRDRKLHYYILALQRHILVFTVSLPQFCIVCRMSHRQILQIIVCPRVNTFVCLITNLIATIREILVHHLNFILYFAIASNEIIANAHNNRSHNFISG